MMRQRSWDKMGLPSALIISCFVLLHHVSCVSCISSPACLLCVLQSSSCIDFRTILQDLACTVDQSSAPRIPRIWTPFRLNLRLRIGSASKRRKEKVEKRSNGEAAKHRIPPSPKGSRLSLNVTGCVSHWLEWQSKVYLSLASVMPSPKPVYLVWQYIPFCGKCWIWGTLEQS